MHIKKEKKMGFVKEFKDFINRGSAIDMAVGIIVGSVMTGVVNSLVKDVIMPPVGMLIGGVDFSNWFIVINKGLGAMVSDLGGGLVLEEAVKYPTIAAANAAGAVTINIGLFVNTLVGFIITMFAVFMFVKVANRVRGVNSLQATVRECPYCKKADVAMAATKCPYCASVLKPIKPPKADDVAADLVSGVAKKINSKIKQIVK
jgi:large conductance mechanosensitive channel